MTPSGPVCGDGVCEGGETYPPCPECQTGPVCGDAVCEAGETYPPCPECLTCNHNGTCEFGSDGNYETAASCSDDCKLRDDVNNGEFLVCETGMDIEDLIFIASEGMVGEPVNVTNGNMYIQHADYMSGGLASELSIVRSYNTNNRQIGIFGLGWTTVVEEYLEIKSPLSIAVHTGNGSVAYYSRVSTTETSFTPYMPPGLKSNIVINPDTTYTLIRRDGIRHGFSSAGKLMSISDRNGNTTSLYYTGDRLTSIQDPAGRTLSISYNAAGRVSSIGDGANHTVDPSYDPSILGTVATYDYDSNSALIQVTYGDNSQYRYLYETKALGSGGTVYLLTTVKDALDNILETHEYDDQGRATTSEKHGGVEKYVIQYVSDTETQTTDALGRVTKYTIDKSRGRNVITEIEGPHCQQAATRRKRTYDFELNLRRTEDQMGYVNSYLYDSEGNVSRIETPTGVREYTYNSYGQVLTQTDAIGGMTNAYNQEGNLISVSDSTGATYAYGYNSRGLLVSKTDPLGNIDNGYNHDQYGNLISYTNALGKTSHFGYDIRGRLIKITGELGHITSYEYDARDRLVKTTYPDNSYATREYDSAGRLRETTDANGNVTQYNYDNAGRLIEIIDAEGKHTTRSYDLMSNVVAQTDAETDAVLRRTTTYDYNDMDRVIRVHHPDGSLHTGYEYDSVGNISKVIDAAGHITQYIRDGGGRIIRTIDPMLNVTAMEYDVHDNLTKVTDAAGNVHEYSYDFNNRLLSESRNNGARVRYNYYDLAGKLTQRKEFDGTITTYEYDVLNRLWKITYPDGNVATFTYDDASRMVTATNENGTVTIGYDNRNRVSGITDVWNKQILYNYDANGNRTRMTLDERVTDYTYNNVNALLTMTESGGNGVVHSYDGLGRLSTSTINSMLITTYDHDRLDQLTNVNHRAGANQLANFHYAYDGNRNIDEITDRSGTHQYSYDFNSRLITGTAQNGQVQSYSYDAIGNHLRPDGTFPPPVGVSHQYNLNGELTKRLDSARPPQPKTVSYAYDALGRRISRTSGAQWTRFTYDGDDVVLDQNSDGTQVYYGNGPGVDNKLWYMQQGSASVFFLKDHLNSTRALVSSSGTIIPGSEIDYDSFGYSTTQIPTRYRYTGREYDPDTELYYYRARWYDPQARRFISEDPIGLNGGINLYAYVRNNPLNSVDPLGLVDAPGTLESFIPVWGSGKQAIHDFETGHYVWGTVNSLVAVSDVFLVKAAATGITKGAIKLGSHSWRATRAWMAKTCRAEAGQEVHHWLIPQGGWGKSVPNAIKNQPWNLMPMESPELHRSIHGVGRNPFGPVEQLIYGTPDWFKASAFSGAGRVGNETR